MPDEPNRNLDEQLSAWARKRRDEAGAPFELHAATRKLLQDEVARTFPKRSNEPAEEPAGGWRMFWPRFALAGSLCLAMVILAGLLLPGRARSKSKTQQMASVVRGEEKDLSAASARRDAPAQIAPDTRGSPAVERQVRHLGDEAARSSVAESQPPAVPSLAQKKQEALVLAESKDTRQKVEQPPKVEERQFSEKNRQFVLSDKVKEAPSPAGAAAAPRALNVENEGNQVLLRQRSALAPAQSGGATSARNALAEEQKLAAAPQTPRAEPQVALDGAHVGQRARSVGGRGFADGTASNTAPGANLAFNRPQEGATADDRSPAFARSSRVATGNVVSLAERGEIDRLVTSNLYFVAVPPTPAPQRFAQTREYRVNLNSPPMPNVLSSFQLVRNGRQIRVVDADDSVYDGEIEPAPTEELAKHVVELQTAAVGQKQSTELEEKRRVSAAAVGETVPSQNVFFRVAGTNRSLNQLVVFEGNFLDKDSQPTDLAVGAKLKASQSAPARQGLPQNARQAPGPLIRGQATIGLNNRIEINAALVSE
jgi:hypothetical protein